MTVVAGDVATFMNKLKMNNCVSFCCIYIYICCFMIYCELGCFLMHMIPQRVQTCGVYSRLAVRCSNKERVVAS